MYDKWLIYGCIILAFIMVLCIVSYIFWHKGFNRGYEEGRAITIRQKRRQRNRNRRIGVYNERH